MTVYFMQAIAGDRRIKIGAVADRAQPESWATPVTGRRIALEKEHNLELRVAALTVGHRFVEGWFHRRHAASSIGHEWFAASDLLLVDVAAMAAGERVDNQPEEPPPFSTFPASLALFYRQQLFKLGQQEMADALGIRLAALKAGEHSRATILRALAYERAASRFGIPLKLSQIVHDAVALSHRPRYRMHVVRSIEART